MDKKKASIFGALIVTIILPILGYLTSQVFSINVTAADKKIISGTLIAICGLTVLMSFTFTFIFFTWFKAAKKALSSQIVKINTETKEYTDLINQRINSVIEKLLLEKEVIGNIIGKEELYIKEAKAEKIWILTSDFHWDLTDETYRQGVLENIANGTEYRYFFPLSKIAKAKTLNKIYRQENPNGKNWELISVPDEYFDLFQYEVAIYDPHNPTSQIHSGVIADIFSGRKTGKKVVDVHINKEHELPYFIDFIEKQYDKFKENKIS